MTLLRQHLGFILRTTCTVSLSLSALFGWRVALLAFLIALAAYGAGRMDSIEIAEHKQVAERLREAIQ